MIIACPAYLIADPEDGCAFDTIEYPGEKWFSIYHDRKLAEDRMRQTGGAIREVTDEEELHAILRSHVQIDGFLVNSPAQPDNFSPIARQQVLGDSN